MVVDDKHEERMGCMIRLWGIILILGLLSLSCNLPTTAGGTPTAEDVDLNATMMALSINQTQTAMVEIPDSTDQATAIIEPSATENATATIEPTSTTIPSATNTSIPCNWAGNIIDVTYEDGSKVDPDTSFVKTWKITNYGSCTWTSGYSLIFDSGDRMDAPGAVSLTSGTVPPGSSVNVSVQLRSPSTHGTYQGNFKLKAPDGTIFGIGPGGTGYFWVLIKVPSPTAAPLLLPDLKITQITTCANPTKGIPCTIKVSVYNSGDASLNIPFVVNLYIGSAADAKCSWTIASISKGGGYVKSCDYTFPSWYGSIALRAVADEVNAIPEKNDGNNQLSINIAVSN